MLGPLAVSPGRCRVVAVVGLHRRRQNDAHRQTGRHLPAAREAASAASSRWGHLSHRGGRAAPHLRGHHRSAHGGGVDSPGDARGGPPALEPRPGAHRHGGRSPRDEVKLQELKAMLGEAQADEVHLVLSSVASAASLASTAEKFAPVGTTAPDPHQTRRVERPGQPAAAAAGEQAAAELFDQRPERAGGHRAGERRRLAGRARHGHGGGGVTHSWARAASLSPREVDEIHARSSRRVASARVAGGPPRDAADGAAPSSWWWPAERGAWARPRWLCKSGSHLPGWAVGRCSSTPICAGDMASLCGLDAHESVADVLAGRLTVHEVMQRGPAGVQVVPGAWGRDSERLASAAAQRRLMAELQDFGRYAEVVIVDAGNGIGEVSHRFWQAAQLVLLVTTPDANAIMDAYACVKVLAEQAPARVLTLVNAAGSPDEAQQVHLRLEQACRRFWAKCRRCGAVPRDPASPARCKRPRLRRGKWPPGPSIGWSRRCCRCCKARGMSWAIRLRRRQLNQPSSWGESPQNRSSLV